MTLALFSSAELPEASGYLGLRPMEPLGGGLGTRCIKEGFDTRGDMYLANLLNLFDPSDWREYGETHVLIGHGTNEAINLGFSEKSPAVLRLKDLIFLCRYIDGKEESMDLKKKYKVDPYEFQEAIERFRTLSLRHLAIRACNIGNNDKYLLSLAELLNVSSISAPIRRDFFTSIKPFKVTVKTLDEKCLLVKHSLVMGKGDDQIMLNFEKGSKPTRFITNAVATSEAAVNNFFRENFDCLNKVSFQFGMSVPIFGINMNHNRLPLIPVFPKHPEYTSYLKVIQNPKFVAAPLPEIPLDFYIPKDSTQPPRKARPLIKFVRKVFGR